MIDPPTPPAKYAEIDEPAEHPQFHSLCADVDDYEPLPEVVPGPADTTPALGRLETAESLNAEILAGLVSP